MKTFYPRQEWLQRLFFHQGFGPDGWGPWANTYQASDDVVGPGLRVEVDLQHGLNVSGVVAGRGLHLGFMPPTLVRRWLHARSKAGRREAAEASRRGLAAVEADPIMVDPSWRARADRVRERVLR